MVLGSILTITALTPIHVGVGRGSFEIDLPIARDEFSIPYIPGSGIKGALRARLRLRADLEKEKGEDLKKLDRTLFGQLPEEPDAVAGSVIISDAILIAVPARSLRGLWCYVTSSFQLRRFIDYYVLATACHSSSCCCKEGSGETKVEKIYTKIEKIEEFIAGRSDSEAFVVKDETIDLLGGSPLIINEEFMLKVERERQEYREFRESLEEVVNIIKKTWDPGCGGEHSEKASQIRRQAARLLEKRLVVVSNNIFRSIVERSLIRQTRVRLNHGTKTVEEGPWTEENLPQLSLLASLVSFTRPREKKPLSIETEDHVRASFIKEVIEPNNPLILGGHETIGRGVAVLGIC